MTHDAVRGVQQPGRRRVRGRLLPRRPRPPRPVGAPARKVPDAEPVVSRSRALPAPSRDAAPAAAPAEVDEPERMELFGRIGVALTVVAAFVHFVAVVAAASPPTRCGCRGETCTSSPSPAPGSSPSATCCSTSRYSLSLALAGRHRLRAGHADDRRTPALHAGRAAARRAAVALAGDPRRRRDHRHRRLHPGRDVLGAVPGQGALGGQQAGAASRAAATSPGSPSSACSTGSPTARTRSASRSGPSRR